MKKYLEFLKAAWNKQLMVDYKMITLKRPRRFKIPAITSYVRINTLELVAQEIYEKKISGSVAEVGVYQGQFAAVLNSAFPDKKLYLFDTFEGFDNKDTALEKTNQFSTGEQDFSKTSVELVLSRMTNKQNCIIKKGWFPQTAEGLNDQFCFVSLDADLYKPIYDGLHFFYPKLSKGGYIFIHDYNNDEYKGVKEAVREFCNQQQCSYTPMSDAWGSVIIAK
jgi:O-methyltransferase